MLVVDEIAQAIRQADGDHTMGAAQLAEVAIDAVAGWQNTETLDHNITLIEQVG